MQNLAQKIGNMIEREIASGKFTNPETQVVNIAEVSKQVQLVFPQSAVKRFISENFKNA